jgi:membrane protein implicated in regulation of membrane protease activity
MTPSPPSAPEAAAGAPKPRRGRPFARYLALQVPGWVLAAGALWAVVRLWALPVAVAYGLWALWIAKDLALYPAVRVAYEDTSPHPTDRLLGAVGRARGRLDPTGWVAVGSELWRAELAPGSPPVEPGARVRVVEVRGFTLRVEAGEDAP